MILKNVRILQGDLNEPNYEVISFKVGSKDHTQSYFVGSGGVSTIHGWLTEVNGLNLDLPLCTQDCGGYYRLILMEVFFEEELTGPYYEIEGEFYFPQYDATCWMDISAEYDETPPPVETTETEETEPPPTEETTEPPPETPSETPTPTNTSGGGGPTD
jgi:hypothetical protein